MKKRTRFSVRSWFDDRRVFFYSFEENLLHYRYHRINALLLFENRIKCGVYRVFLQFCLSPKLHIF